MNTLMDPAISTLTYRISQTERRIEELQDAIKGASEMIQAMSHGLAVARGEIAKGNRKAVQGVVNCLLNEKDIIVPEQLKITKAKRGRGKRIGGGGNRIPEVVSKRWAMWKAQMAMGYTSHQIARAWGCCRTTVENAKYAKFKAAGA
jgi:hypothetical protein